jgi:hypothetical protein
MKKIKLIILFAGLLYGNLIAQTDQVKIVWTDEMEKSRYLNFANVLGKDQQGFYIVNENTLSSISAGKQTAIIEKYDHQMKQIFSKELIVKYHENEVAYYSSNKLGDKFYLFTTFWDNKEKVKYFLANVISPNGEIVGDSKSVFDIPEQGRGAPSISMSISFDSTKILLYTDIKEKKDELESYHFKAMDQNLNKIWENTISLPYDSKKFEIQRYLIDNEANLHILGKVKRDRKEREKGEPGFYYTLISYFHTTKEIKEFTPDLGDAYASGIGIKPDKDGNILATGFYSEKSENSLRGVFYMKINPGTKSVLTQKVKNFDTDFLSLFLSEKKAAKGEELYNYSIDHIEIDKEGNTVVVAEQYYVQTYTTTNSSGYTSTRYVYNYNHILIVKFSPQGEVLWWSKVPKRQRGGDPTYFSYMYAMKNNNIYILYNEHKKNLENLDPKDMYTLGNPKDAITSMIAIDAQGKLTKVPMFESRDDEGNTIFKPSTSKRLSESESLVLSIRGKKYKIGKIQF